MIITLFDVIYQDIEIKLEDKATINPLLQIIENVWKVQNGIFADKNYPLDKQTISCKCKILSLLYMLKLSQSYMICY